MRANRPTTDAKLQGDAKLQRDAKQFQIVILAHHFHGGSARRHGETSKSGDEAMTRF